MKNFKYYLMALASIAMLNACSDDDPVPGNPTMDFQAEPSSALFGDSLPFTIKASDADVPLSTLKAQLYFSDEMVSETVIRTKVSGQEYNGKIYVPYLANIPNGTATLKFILQNINFTITEKSYDVALSRPDFPYLTLISGDQEYRMEKVAANQYSVTSEFAQKVKGYIKAPKVGANGNEINFGWSNGAITQGTSSEITFSSLSAGKYSISFNTLTYAAAPFVKLLLNGSEMEMVDAKSSTVEPLASLNKSPFGVNTNTSSSYKSSLNWSIVSSPLLSELSKASRTEVSHSSRPDSPFTPLYRQWAARPRSAISSMRSVRICTSTHLPSGPITVMCSDSYPLLLGTDSQSRSRFGLGWYISVTME